uniref:Tumor necrosis factor receptor superfamily member 4-like isoform X1 n=1 Tax=Petromyzon marinus TaxID=7757 RepID=A0AAJ7XH07_PETMA|nr:tumor necrosis factor receptor superfamily member 4-like isoform X1 [Petromyzon marinus]
MAYLAILTAALCVLIGGVHTSQGFCNRSTQYELNGLCCDQCPSGHFRSAWCTADSPTDCQPCPEGTYNSEYNIYPRFEYCTRCIPAFHQVKIEGCTRTRNARCGCEKDENISKFAKQGTLFWCCPKCPAGMETLNECSFTDFVTTCSPCPPGTFSDHPGSRCRNCTRCERVQSPCTNASDAVCSGFSKVTKCTDCPPGTFRDRSGSPCKNCTRCERELSPCTNASDAVCSGTMILRAHGSGLVTTRDDVHVLHRYFSGVYFINVCVCCCYPGPDVSANGKAHAAIAAGAAVSLSLLVTVLMVLMLLHSRRASVQHKDAPLSDSSAMDNFSTQSSLATLQRPDEVQSMLNACNDIE